MAQDNKPYTSLDANQTIEQSFVDGTDAHRIISLGAALPFTYDYVSMALSGGDSIETYTFRNGGSPRSTGDIVGVVTVTYTSSARSTLVSADFNVS